MSIRQYIMYLGSKPAVNTSIRTNQQKWLATGLEKHRSHSNYLMDELADQVSSSDIQATSSVAIEWCGKTETLLEGNRYLQVLTDIQGTPSAIWFQLPSITPISAPDANMIEKCCCDGEQSNEVLTAVLDIHTELEAGGYSILTTGSRNGQGDNIEADSNYRYTDTIEFAPDWVNSEGIIVTITALGGDTIDFDWTDSIITAPADQTAMEVLLNSVQGYMNAATGYQIGKIGMQDIFEGYLSTNTPEIPHIVGGQWKITRVVELVADTGVNGSDSEMIAEGRTDAKYSSPKDVARFKYNSNNSTGLFVADYDNDILSIVYDLENTPFSLTAYTFASNVRSVMVDESEVVNGYPSVYVLLESGQIRKLTRNVVNDYTAEANNWLDTLVISLAPGVTFATIDPTRTGSGGSPIFFVGMEAAFGLIQVVQDTGGGYGASSLEDTGSVLDSAADAYEVEDIQIHTNGDLYYVLRGQVDNIATAIVRAELTGADIATAGDWTHTIIAGDLTARGDAVGAGDVAKFFGAYGLFITGSVDTTGPIIHLADNGNLKLKKIVPTSGQDITNPANWTVSHVAGDGTLANNEGSGLAMSLPDLICGHYYADTDEIYVASDLYSHIYKIAGVSAETYDKTRVEGINSGQRETNIW